MSAVFAPSVHVPRLDAKSFEERFRAFRALAREETVSLDWWRDETGRIVTMKMYGAKGAVQMLTALAAEIGRSVE